MIIYFSSGDCDDNTSIYRTNVCTKTCVRKVIIGLRNARLKFDQDPNRNGEKTSMIPCRSI